MILNVNKNQTKIYSEKRENEGGGIAWREFGKYRETKAFRKSSSFVTVRQHFERPAMIFK